MVLLGQNSVIGTSFLTPQICLEERQRNSFERQALQTLHVNLFDTAEGEDGCVAELRLAVHHVELLR